jgi:glycosyltransferase involved in cell wall biosynthesis
MRIAEIAPPWFTVPPSGYGGIETVVHTLVEGLVEQGHDVTLFAAPGSRTSARLVSPLDGAVAMTDPIAPDLETAYVLQALRQAEDFDVVHVHTWMGALLAAVMEGPPVVHTLHGPWDERARVRYPLVADRVGLVAISDAQRRANRGVAYAGRVHNGVDHERLPFRAEKEDFLLFLGRSCPAKGPDRAIRVARMAGKPIVMIVKRMEPREIDYWDHAVAPLLGSDVEVLGDGDKQEALCRASATLFPISWDEPFGMVMVESMACGTPVLATPMGAAPEVVEDGATGFLCPTLEDMAAATERVAALSPHACRARVAERFSKRSLSGGYRLVFEAAVRDRSGRGPVLATTA